MRAESIFAHPWVQNWAKRAVLNQVLRRVVRIAEHHGAYKHDPEVCFSRVAVRLVSTSKFTPSLAVLCVVIGLRAGLAEVVPDTIAERTTPSETPRYRGFVKILNYGVAFSH